MLATVGLKVRMYVGDDGDGRHKEAPWKETRYLEDIPYSLAGKDSDSKFSSQEIEELLSVMV